MLKNLSGYWKSVQKTLLPMLRETLPKFEAHHERVASVLEILKVEEFIPLPINYMGRKKKSRASIARAFVTKSCLNISETKELIRTLTYDHALRIMCGWDYYWDLPSESTFSRAFAEFAGAEFPEQIHEALTKAVFEDRPVMHLSRDATDIAVRERGIKKPAAIKLTGGKKSKKGEGKCDLQLLSNKSWKDLLGEISSTCDSGSKVSSRGSRLYWRGYKFHVDVNEIGFPIACALTSASVNDALLAIPLSMKSSERAKVYYELMDKGYYAGAIDRFIRQEGRVPIIAKCPKNKAGKERMQQEELARKTVSWFYAEEIRFRHRTTVERFFGKLKDLHCARNIRLRSHSKVYCHLMFSVIALAAEQLIRVLN